MTPRSGSAWGLPLLVGVVAMVVSGLFLLRVVVDSGGDTTILVGFGETATEIEAYAEERLGEVFLRRGHGHDGKYFFVQANDPWVMEPEENAAILDRPLYRSQRMLYPVIVGAGGTLGPEAITWTMIVVNLVALGAGTVAVALISNELGGSAWWGLAFGLNLGFISEMTISGSGILAAALAFWAVLFLMRSYLTPALVLLALAVLSREAMLIVAFGAGAWYWFRAKGRREAVLLMSVPVGAALVWAGYLRLRIDTGSAVSEIQEFGWPFGGFVEAFDAWRELPFSMVAGITMMTLLLLFIRRVVVTPHLLGWSHVGFAVMAILFTEQVWENYFDITRAVAPAVTAFLLLAFVVTRSEIRHQNESAGSAATRDRSQVG